MADEPETELQKAIRAALNKHYAKPFHVRRREAEEMDLSERSGVPIEELRSFRFAGRLL